MQPTRTAVQKGDNMGRFKVGDVVIRTQGAHMNMKAGDIAVVTNVDGEVELDRYGGKHSYDNLEIYDGFMIGETVKFVGKRGGDSVPFFYTDSYIPKEKIVHGSTILHQDYSKEFALVVDQFAEYYIVEYKDQEGQKVRLGFKKEVLEIAKPEDNIKALKAGSKVIASVPRDDIRWKYNNKTGKIFELLGGTGVIDGTEYKYQLIVELEEGSYVGFNVDELELV